MRTEIAGVEIGHWTDERARTGCTVINLPSGTIASGEVRGGAPATREFALLDPTRTVGTVDAIVLAGGSAHGLAAADGVVRWSEQQGRGFPTMAGRVPIVVAMALYDLAEGDASVRPGPDAGHTAATLASAEFSTGQVGAGTGATVGKWRGRGHVRRGGLGAAVHRSGDLRVCAVVAVNAAGDIDDGSTLDAVRGGAYELPEVDALSGVENTTVGVVVTNAELTKLECNEVARVGHGAFARAIVPVHTSGDGDALVVAATGEVPAAVALVRLLALAAVEDAIRSVAV